MLFLTSCQSAECLSVIGTSTQMLCCLRSLGQPGAWGPKTFCRMCSALPCGCLDVLCTGTRLVQICVCWLGGAAASRQDELLSKFCEADKYYVESSLTQLAHVSPRCRVSHDFLSHSKVSKLHLHLLFHGFVWFIVYKHSWLYGRFEDQNLCNRCGHIPI